MGGSSSSSNKQVEYVPKQYAKKSKEDRTTSPWRRRIEKRLGLREAIISPGVIVVEPVPGLLSLGQVDHHAIYIGNDKVIGFSEKGIRCIQIPMNTSGTFYKWTDLFWSSIVDHTVKIWQKSQKGTYRGKWRGENFNVLTHNCRHFCNRVYRNELDC